MRMNKSLASGLIFCAVAFFSTNSWADGSMKTYHIEVTNLTPGQPISPVMAATHNTGMSFFQAGAAPTPELAELAEAGNANPLADLLMMTPGYSDVQIAASAIGPGETISIMITTSSGKKSLSLGAMLVNTNDAFIALRDVALPKGMQKVTYFADVYDAGSETNNESCSAIPGPACGGAALSPDDDGEGFVHIHNGIHGMGELNPAIHDWRNPAAQIVISRMK